jgi:hypothetical protein
MLVVLVVLGFPLQTRAGLILDAEVRVTAEDNVVGLLSGGDAAGTGTMSGMQAASLAPAGGNGGKGFGSGSGGGTGTMGGSGTYLGSGTLSPGDLSFSLRAELGGYADTGDHLSFFGKGYAERTSYQEYTLYDQALAGLSAGVTAYLGRYCSLTLRGFSEVSRYENDPDRDATSVGGTASMRQRLGSAFSLRETAEYVSSEAAYQDFSYRGPSYGLRAVYDATDVFLLTTGYRFRARYYRDPALTTLRSRTALFGADYQLGDHWTTGLLYERESSATGTTDVITRNNILSLTLRYAY